MDKTIKTSNISFPEVEKLLTESRTELIDIAKRDGKYAGLKSLPGLKDESSAAHLAPLKAQAEQRRSAALAILQPDLHITAIERVDANLKVQQDQVNTRIEELTHHNDVDRRELDGKCPPERTRSNIPGLLLLIITGLADLAFNAGAFEALGDTLGFAIGIATGVAVATFALAKGIEYCLRRAICGERKWWFYTGGLMLVALSGFWVLSGFRSQQIAMSGVEDVSPGQFFLLNLFFFIAAIIIGMLFFTPDSKRTEERELARRFEVIRQREDEIKALKQKLEELTAKSEEDRDRHTAIVSYCIHIINRFRALYFEAVALWKSTNLLSRPDHSIPSSFSEPVADLDPLQFDIPPSPQYPKS